MAETTLGDLAEIRVGFPFPSSEFLKDGAGTRLLRGDNIAPGSLRWDNAVSWPTSKAVDDDYDLCAGDVVLAMDRPWIGGGLKTATLRPQDLPAFLVQRVARLRAKPGTSQGYLAALVASDCFTQYVLSVQTGTAVPHISARQIAAFPVQPLPPHAQKSVAEVLGALDDKIAANTRVEALGAELIASRFLEAVRSESQVVALAELAIFRNRERVPLSSREREARPGAVPYYGASGVFGYVDSQLFDTPLLLVGEDGSVITEDRHPVTQYIWGPSWVNNHAHVLEGRGISTELLHLAVTQADVSTLVTGAVQPKISMGNLKTLALAVPTGEAAARIERQTHSWYACHRALMAENARLAATRDSLLPALMSGKLRVRDAGRTVEQLV